MAFHFEVIHPPTYTEDVDIVIERRKFRQKIIQTSSDQLSQELKLYGYEPKFKSVPLDSSEVPPEKWQKPESEYYFEFLTEDSQKKNHRIAGVVAQGLSYFNLSLENRINVLLPSGNTLPVVSPAAFMTHKILTYKNRIEDSKKIKDLYYITYVAQFIFKEPKCGMQAISELKMPLKWWQRVNGNIQDVYANIDKLTKKIIQSDEYGAFNERAIKATWQQSSNYNTANR